jgi:hypothetical protein
MGGPVVVAADRCWWCGKPAPSGVCVGPHPDYTKEAARRGKKLWNVRPRARRVISEDVDLYLKTTADRLTALASSADHVARAARRGWPRLASRIRLAAADMRAARDELLTALADEDEP